MWTVLTNSWALFLGMFMLMIGNGLQGTLLGVRGNLEGFTTFQMSLVMSAYFLGFLFASRMAPEMIRRVGHVRVFAALASSISAVLIMYPALTEVWAWIAGRAVIGFCFCGVYIVAESWLNDASTNETRGKSLSLYLVVQMAGIVLAQYILVLGDISGFILFIIPSILVSLSFAPILLSVRPVPAFETTKPMNLRNLYRTSPLSCVGLFLLGGIFAAQFGMTAVYGSLAGLTVGQISLLVSAIYIAALVLQYPIGWMSDRVDRRILILAISAIGGFGALLPLFIPGNFTVILIGGAFVGGTSNPLYALLLAYANDYLEREDMAAASGGFLFINGVGAIAGPIVIGWLMGLGSNLYWLAMAVLMLSMAAYAGWRMTQRSRRGMELGESATYTPVLASATQVAVEAAQELYAEEAVDELGDGAATEQQGEKE